MADEASVVLIRSAASIKAADLLPSNIGRATRVHALINAFKLDTHPNLATVAPEKLSDSELQNFHSAEYIRHLLGPGDSSSDTSDSGSDSSGSGSEFGLQYDCPTFEGLDDYVRYTAGGTVAAARSLMRSAARTAIHWEGGRHHCGRSRASGFCYVNDVVLGILELQKAFGRILYVDLDLHHGDGVQDAFQYSSRVMTLSVHNFERGFFPNSGAHADEGQGRGAGYAMNVPLRRGVRDALFVRAMRDVVECAMARFGPDVVVVQCGCDGLAGDPNGVFNLTTDAYSAVVGDLVARCAKVLVLGGGGYNLQNCAKCWTRLTAVAVGEDLLPEADVPEHEFWAEYAPAFDMAVDVRLVDDENTPESVMAVVEECRRKMAV